MKVLALMATFTASLHAQTLAGEEQIKLSTLQLVASADASSAGLSEDYVTNKYHCASAGGYPGAGYLTVAPRTLLVSATFNF